MSTAVALPRFGAATSRFRFVGKELVQVDPATSKVVRSIDGQWIAVRLMEEPLKALTQSYTRTKAKDYKQYWQTMELKANSSNNTIGGTTPAERRSGGSDRGCPGWSATSASGPSTASPSPPGRSAPAVVRRSRP